MKNFEYKNKDKVAFYIQYFFRKIFTIWFEVKSPKFKMFFLELSYSIEKIIHIFILPIQLFKIEKVVNKYGTFILRPGTEDAIVASPVFERPDINYLSQLLRQLEIDSKRIMFLDIGSDFGGYSIIVGNMTNDKTRIYSFEPAKKSYSLLQSNIMANNLKTKVKTFNYALSKNDNEELSLNIDPDFPGGSSIVNVHLNNKCEKIKAMKLDTLIGKDYKNFDVIVMKMDVEGYESIVLEGAKSFLQSNKKIYVMVEDFINPSIIKYLELHNFEFITKITPYNSWWKLN